jgi:peroxiredoxin
VLFLAFLLLGSFRTVSLLNWRIDQLEATTPRRIGRDGLKCGIQAPDFTLPGVAGADISLGDFAGRKRLLVFSQIGCPPCHAIVPDLNKLQRTGSIQVLAVLNSDAENGEEWARHVKAEFPVALQQEFKASKQFEVFASPFAFLISELGVIESKGFINSPKHLGYVLAREGRQNAEGGTRYEKTDSEPLNVRHETETSHV